MTEADGGGLGDDVSYTLTGPDGEVLVERGTDVETTMETGEPAPGTRRETEPEPDRS